MPIAGIVDTHAHLDAPQFDGDLPAVLHRAEKAGVARMICVATDRASADRCPALARRYPGRIWPTAGIHPNSWSDAARGDFEHVQGLARNPLTVAVGETGLDFHHEHTPRAEQVRAFERHVELALAVGKPVIVHARNSDDEVLDVLRSAGDGLRGVRHCFDRPMDVAERYLELGFFVALGAAVTRPGYKRFKAAARELPADRILLETDCPYQSPASRAGGRNEPAYIVETLEALAELRDEPPEHLAAVTTANAERLFFPGAAGT